MSLQRRVIVSSIDYSDDKIDITGNMYSLPEQNGIMIIDRQDANGNATPSLQEIIIYTILDYNASGLSLRGVQRGAMGSSATSHMAGASIELVLTGPVNFSNPLKDELKKLL